MTVLNLGDLSTTFQQKRSVTRIKTDLQDLTSALSSGQVSDLRGAVRGNFTMLSSLQNQLNALESYTNATNEAVLFGSMLQSSLGTVQSNAEDLAPELLSSADGGNQPWISATSKDARSRFGTVVSALNATVAGRTLMAGTATSTAALADSETMLAELVTVVAAETTAAGVETAVEAWFDTPGGGFETNGYLGSDTSLQDMRISPTEAVSMDVKASDQEIRDILKGFAMAALVDAGALPTQTEEQAALLRSAGERMFTANGGLAILRGAVGSAEAAVDEAQARNASETSSLEMARNTIIAADPYTVAVELEAAQLQLESLFALTARMSRLNLTEFL